MKEKKTQNRFQKIIKKNVPGTDGHKRPDQGPVTSNVDERDLQQGTLL